MSLPNSKMSCPNTQLVDEYTMHVIIIFFLSFSFLFVVQLDTDVVHHGWAHVSRTLAPNDGPRVGTSVSEHPHLQYLVVNAAVAPIPTRVYT